jgi:hypothetical protein
MDRSMIAVDGGSTGSPVSFGDDPFAALANEARHGPLWRFAAALFGDA